MDWFWTGFGLVWKPFWTGFGLVLDWFWTGFEAILDCFWTGFGLVWKPFWTGIGLVLDWFWTGLEAILDWFWTGFGLVLDWFGSKRNTPFHDYTRNTHDTFYHQNQNQQITHLTPHPSIGFPSLLPLTTFRCITAPGHVQMPPPTPTFHHFSCIV